MAIDDVSLAPMIPRDLSLAGMAMGSGPVVGAVIAGLLVASVLVWTICLAAGVEQISGLRALGRAQGRLNKAGSFALLAGSPDLGQGDAGALVAAAEGELALLGDHGGQGGALDRIALKFERIEAAAARSGAAATAVIGTIAATAPFVGLFGTVWGIMDSFIGISAAHATSLSVVAPGIAEALLTTALGLFTAIPAVICHNLLTRLAIARRARVADAAAEILRLVSRDLDRRPGGDT